MKKKGKIILTVVLVLAIAAVVAAVAAFRPQPVLDPAGTYEVQRVNYWLEGPNLEWEGYLHTMPTPEQAQEILALLEGYEKQLSTDRLPQRLLRNLLPAQFQSMEVQLPEWLEAAIFIWTIILTSSWGTATSRSGTGTPISPLTMRFPTASSSTRNWTPSCTWTSAWPNCETDPIPLPPPARVRRGRTSYSPSYYNLATICRIPLPFLFISCILSVEAPIPSPTGKEVPHANR